MKTVVHVPSGEFKNKQGLFECGAFEPQQPMIDALTPDPNYTIVTLPAGTVVDSKEFPRTKKWSGGLVVAKAQADIDVYDNAEITAMAVAASKANKDVVATVAWTIRFKDPVAWSLLTLVQKRDAVLAELENWKPLREFVQRNL